MAEENNDLLRLGHICYYGGNWAIKNSGDIWGAKRMAERALDLYTRMGMSHMVMECSDFLAWLVQNLDMQKAREYLETIRAATGFDENVAKQAQYQTRIGGLLLAETRKEFGFTMW